MGRKFKRGVKDKGIGHWVNGVEEDRRMARKAGEGKKRERKGKTL